MRIESMRCAGLILAGGLALAPWPGNGPGGASRLDHAPVGEVRAAPEIRAQAGPTRGRPADLMPGRSRATQPNPGGGALETLFAYDASTPIDLRVSGGWIDGRARGREVTYRSLTGGEIGATLVEPLFEGTHAGVLFVHWYEPEAPASNRTQFRDEASRLAERGTVSLLIDTMWSDPTWFRSRDRGQDFDNSVRQVKELRRALDVLLSLARVDRERIGYVGHDFGAVFGAVLAGVDRRVSAYALQAATTSLTDWYLLFPPLEGAARQRFIEVFAPIDPVRLIGAAAPVPLLLQFGTDDPYVPRASAEALAAAASEPKTIMWYEGGHGLTPEAVQDRMEWLATRLRLGPAP